MSAQGAGPSTRAAGAPSRLLLIEQGGRGGVADYTGALTRALGARGWQVELATAEDHRYEPAEGVTVHRVFRYLRGVTPIGHALRAVRLGWMVNGLRFLRAIPRLLRLSRRVDIVHTQGWELSPLGLVAVACLRLSGARVVQTAHNTFERGRPFPRTNRALARLTAATIVHTRADVERAAAQWRLSPEDPRLVVIPHGEYGGLARTGGTADREQARARLGLSPVEPVTLMFGQLRLDKGLDQLLAALELVPDLRLIVAGQEEGALAASRAQLESAALAGRVIVREGFLEMSEAAQLFAAADTAVLPYSVASQSGVLLLAYGFQRPVVVYPVGGLVEAVIDGETGWICARADVDALAETLQATVRAGWEECRRRGEAGAQLAETRFAWPAIAARTEELYERVLARV